MDFVLTNVPWVLLLLICAGLHFFHHKRSNHGRGRSSANDNYGQEAKHGKGGCH